MAEHLVLFSVKSYVAGAASVADAKARAREVAQCASETLVALGIVDGWGVDAAPSPAAAASVAVTTPAGTAASKAVAVKGQWYPAVHAGHEHQWFHAGCPGIKAPGGTCLTCKAIAPAHAPMHYGLGKAAPAAAPAAKAPAAKAPAAAPVAAKNPRVGTFLTGVVKYQCPSCGKGTTKETGTCNKCRKAVTA